MSTVVGSVAIASSKLQEAAKSKNVTRTGKEKEANKTKVKSKVSAEAQKKPFKIVIRKLPVRDFNKDDFRASVMRVMTQLGYPSPEVIDGASPDVDKEVVQIEHFIEGKLRYIL